MIKSVQSLNPCLAGRQACQSVIQTIYDIVTKGHGGTIELDSESNIGSTFIVTIPI